MKTRENRIITIAEDYGDTVLCITNLDNDTLKNVLVHLYNDCENGIGRSTTEIVEEWVNAKKLPINAYITELTDTQSSDIIEIKDVDTKCIAYYRYLTANVVKGAE